MWSEWVGKKESAYTNISTVVDTVNLQTLRIAIKTEEQSSFACVSSGHAKQTSLPKMEYNIHDSSKW